MADQFTVVSAKCGVEPEIIADADGEAAMCPSCRRRDRLEDASRIAGEHFLQEAIPGLQKRIGDAFSGKFTSFEVKRVTRRAFRWHAKAVDP